MKKDRAQSRANQLRRKQERQLRRAGKPIPDSRPPIVLPPEGVPVFMVERTGRVFYHQGFRCGACQTYAREAITVETYGSDWPNPRPTRVCECGATAVMNSRGAEEEFRRVDSGEIVGDQRSLPTGAVYEARPWRGDGELSNWVSNLDAEGKPFEDPSHCRLLERMGVDGRVLVCRLPDGTDWVIDSRCNNCTHPHDDEHWCWNRSGSPEAGDLDVRKGKPGQTTCDAGAGSIQTGRWHGFLHGGRLVQS